MIEDFDSQGIWQMNLQSQGIWRMILHFGFNSDFLEVSSDCFYSFLLEFCFWQLPDIWNGVGMLLFVSVS